MDHPTSPSSGANRPLSQGRGRATTSSGHHPPAAKRRAMTVNDPLSQQSHTPVESINLDVTMESVEDDPHGGADSGGSVYRSDQNIFFLSCAPLYHIHNPITLININLANYNPVFTEMYEAFLHTCYASQAAFMPITLNNFIRVCRLCLKARIDFIYMRQTGARALDRVNLNQAPEMPRCLAEIVNGIGFVSVIDQYIDICPHAQQEIEPVNERAGRTPHEIVGQFSLLAKNIALKGFTTLVPLSRTEDGTRYWLMQVRDIVVPQPRTAAGYAEIVNCKIQIDNSTPADVMLAAIVQNGFDGVIPPLNFFIYDSDPVTGVASIRTKFFLTK